MARELRVAVVIPCYRVKRHIADVVAGLKNEVHGIFCVDDACPEGSGQFISENIKDSRVQVLFHDINQGVGAAVLTGFQAAMDQGFDIFIKMDGDGQMDPCQISRLVSPIVSGRADYAKGNRFFFLGPLRRMPLLRLCGNSGLSFVNKVCSGYWSIMDPTNGYVAIHALVFKELDREKLARRFFFESDMLCHLSLLKARVVDVPMIPHYGNEKSNLRIMQVLWDFPPKYVRGFCRRLLYMYLIRDFNIGTVALLAGAPLFSFGLIFGAYHWFLAANTLQLTPLGTIMLSVLTLSIGFQLLVTFFSFDIWNEPQEAIWKTLEQEHFFISTPF